MKAVYIKEYGGPENLEIREVENPLPPQGKEVLVKIHAAALNRADLLQRLGKYPAPKGFPERILGLEFAGEIIEIGEEVENFKIGERVFGITAGGAQAELLLTDASLLAKIPGNISFTEAAAVPEAFITAHDAIFTNGKLKENETLLIHAVGSGVGLAALQLAKACGAKVCGTSRTESKLNEAVKLGLDEAILASKENDFSSPVKEKGGADVILDLVGAGYFQGNIDCLSLKGRIVFVGTTGGVKTELNINQIMSKRAKLIGTVLRSRPTAEKARATAAFVGEVIPLLELGAVRPIVDRTFRLEDIREAHEYLESNASFGKVVLEF